MPLPANRLEAPADLDREATSLTEAIANTASCLVPRKRDSARGNPWWTDECAKALRERHQPGGAQKARKAIKQAKKSHYEGIIAKAHTARQVFQIASWHKQEREYGTVPLQAGQGRYAVTGEEENEATQAKNPSRSGQRRGLSARRTQSPGPHAYPFPPPGEEEVRRAILNAGNTAPGDDEITVSLLRLAWPSLACRLTALCQAALRLGHHPQPFRSADVVFIPKPGKRDRSLPKAYRPISLLRTIGKGIERLVAKRLSWGAIRYKLLHPSSSGHYL